MHGLLSLARGLLISVVIAATVFGAFSLSLHRSSNLLAELPMPVETLDWIDRSPTPAFTPSATKQLPPSVTLAISPTPSITPSPTPTACPLPAGWQRYIVGPFDTLALLAQRFSLSPDQLASANCLTQPVVTVGQTIFVPAFKPTFTPVACRPYYNWASYIVQPGDTLSTIAQRYNIPLYLLITANCLTTNYIYAGQRLLVPWTYPIATITPIPTISTVTPTPIASLTPTETATPPAEATPTDTPIPTITVAPGETPTETPTVTPLPTDTATPVPTATVTPVPTDTPAPPPSTPIPTDPPLNTPEPTIATTP